MEKKIHKTKIFFLGMLIVGIAFLGGYWAVNKEEAIQKTAPTQSDTDEASVDVDSKISFSGKILSVQGESLTIADLDEEAGANISDSPAGENVSPKAAKIEITAMLTKQTKYEGMAREDVAVGKTVSVVINPSESSEAPFVVSSIKGIDNIVKTTPFSPTQVDSKTSPAEIPKFMPAEESTPQ